MIIMKKILLMGAGYTHGDVKIFGVNLKKIRKFFNKRTLDMEIIRILNRVTKKTKFRQLNTEVFEDEILILVDGHKIISFQKKDNRTEIFFDGLDPQYEYKRFVMIEFLKLRNKRTNLVEEFYQKVQEIKK